MHAHRCPHCVLAGRWAHWIYGDISLLPDGQGCFAQVHKPNQQKGNWRKPQTHTPFPNAQPPSTTAQAQLGSVPLHSLQIF